MPNTIIYGAGKKFLMSVSLSTKTRFIKNGVVRLDIPKQSWFPITLKLKETDFIGIPEVLETGVSIVANNNI